VLLLATNLDYRKDSLRLLAVVRLVFLCYLSVKALNLTLIRKTNLKNFNKKQ
jgi:hypothetical protein